LFGELTDVLKQRLRPEFLNRVDEIVMFHPLGHDEIRHIVDIQFEHVRRLAARSNGLKVELSDEARDYLARVGFDPVFGARPLKRVIQREITNKLAEEILSGWLEPDETVRITLVNNGLSFETVPTPAEPA